MRLRPILALVLAVAVVALLAYGLFAKNKPSIAVGETAPTGTLPLLDGGGTVDVSEFRGQWVLLNFWASWCDPCRIESPEIQKWSEEHRGEVKVLGVNTEDLTDDAKQFVREFGLTWEMARDGDGKFKDQYGIYALPESFLIDPAGNLALIQRGTVDTKFLDTYVTPLIEQGSGSGAGSAGAGSKKGSSS